MSRPSPNTSVAISAIRKASRLIVREFLEIQQLQSSKYGATRFAKKSKEKILRAITEELLVARPDFAIGKTSTKFSWVVIPIEGFKNYERGIENFSIAISLLEKDENNVISTVSCAVEDPITQHTFWTEKGKGAYKEDQNGFNQKLKASLNDSFENALIYYDNFENNEFIEKVNANNIRMLGSDIAGILRIASGSLDIFVSSELRNNTSKYFTLFASEAGAKISYPSSGKAIISNLRINELRLKKD